MEKEANYSQNRVRFHIDTIKALSNSFFAFYGINLQKIEDCKIMTPF